MCPFSDTPVPDDGECPDGRPPPQNVEPDFRPDTWLDSDTAERAAEVDAWLGPLRQEAWELARAGAAADALELIDARLAAENEMCETMEGGAVSCVGTLEELDATHARSTALRVLRCDLLVDAGIVSECWALPTVPVLPGEGLSHPKVQADARAVLEDVVVAHEQEWPWLREAWESSEVVFYDSELPEMCSGVACALDGLLDVPTPMMLFTLDVVGADRHGEVLVHELAHVWAHSGGAPAREVRDLFASHYAGCYTSGLSSERFVNELLADAAAVMTLGLDGHEYGYYGLDFDGCLVEGPPPEALSEALRTRLSGLELSSGV